MKKKILSVLIIGVLSVTTISVSPNTTVNAVEVSQAVSSKEFKSGSLTFRVNKDGKTVTLIKCGSKSSSITLPSKVTYNKKSYTVNSIGQSCFAKLTNLKTLTLPDTIKVINDYAFNGCKSLTTINLPEGLTEIKGYAFKGCSSLSNITLPNTLTKMGSGIFSGCTKLKSITIPKSITKASYAFNGSSIESIVFDENIKTIPVNICYNSKKLNSVTLPSKVTKICGNAFTNCCSLKSIELPNTIKTIEPYAFKNTGLTSVTLPKYLSEGKNAFYGSPITYAKISSAKLSIPSNVFNGCSKLTKVSIPASIQVIESEAFKGLKNLSEVIFEEGSLTTIEAKAFADCKNLKKISLPKTLTSIDDTAFSNCPNLVIRTEKDSYVYKYAVKNNIKVSTETVEDLVNSSTIYDYTLKTGDKVILLGSASGGTGDYRYSYYYTEPDSTNKVALAVNSRSTKVSKKLNKIGTYRISISVKDSSGEVKTKSFNVKVSDSKLDFKLTSNINNNSYVSVKSKLECSVEPFNGSPDYKLIVYGKIGKESDWVRLSSVKPDDKSFSYNLTKAGKYYFKILIYDKNNEKEYKEFQFTVR